MAQARMAIGVLGVLVLLVLVLSLRIRGGRLGSPAHAPARVPAGGVAR
jgi:hypothetical protein